MLDQLYTLLIALNGAWEFAKLVHIFLMDLKKAFDLLLQEYSILGPYRPFSQYRNGVLPVLLVVNCICSEYKFDSVKTVHSVHNFHRQNFLAQLTGGGNLVW